MKYLPLSGENLFQRIKRYIREYEAINGAGKSINIAVGEPDTNPPELLRTLVAKAVLENDNAVHTYWDNRAPEGLCEAFVLHNTGIDLHNFPHLSTLLIPGEKPIFPLLPIACGANRSDSPVDNVGYMKTSPAYDLIETWSEYLGEISYVLPLYSHENFRLKVENIPHLVRPRMILTVKPGNPCPVGASKEEWEEIIDYCIKNKVRLVNDGAYAGVVHKNHIALSQVAVHYPKLEWMELFSISKTLSACGWRLGVAVGSKDFIEELTKIKGNSDSGIFGPLGVGLNEYLKTPQSKEDMKSIQQMYQQRLEVLVPIFKQAGFQLACECDAGFFMLFHCPKTLNGQAISSSEDFNTKMIEAIGLVGVPFVGSPMGNEKEQFIRYSACYNSLDPEKLEILKKALNKIKIS